LFTNPIVEIKELAADFLFVLCKSNGKCFESTSLCLWLGESRISV